MRWLVAAGRSPDTGHSHSGGRRPGHSLEGQREKFVPQADATLDEAEALLIGGEYHHALVRLREVRTLYAGLDLSDDVAYCDYRIGTVLDDLGHHREAEQALVLARDQYEVAGDWVSVARCDQALGSAAFQQDRHDEALSHFDAARLRLLAYGSDPGEIDMCDGNRGLVFLALGDQERAGPLLRAALVASQSAGLEHAVSRWQLNLGNLAMAEGDLDSALQRFQTARAGFDTAGRRLEAGYCQHNLANIYAALGDLDTAKSCIHAAREAYLEGGLTIKVAAADLSLGCMALSTDDQVEALSRLQDARCSFEEAGLSMATAMCDHDLALVARQCGETGPALAHALAALVVIDAHRYTFRESPLRRAWSLRWASLYHLSFELADEAGDAALVAELIESARVQGVPALSPEDGQARAGLQVALAMAAEGSAPGATAAVTDDAGGAVESKAGAARTDVSVALAALGLLPLGPCPPVAIDGRSRLAELDPRSPRPSTVSLSVVRASIGGGDAWWWGTWESGDTLWWSVMAPERAPAWGSIDLSPGSRAHFALARLRRCLPDPLPGESNHEAFARQARGALGMNADPGSQEALIRSLGEELLPGPLITELQSRSGEEVTTPLALVIAPAPVLSKVPFALLAVPGCRAGQDPLRVAETATVRLAPSVALLDALSARRVAPTGGRRPLEVAVLDPSGDLLHAGSAPPGARRILAGARIIGAQPPDIAGPATCSAFAQALADVGSGSTGVLVFLGHATPGARGEPSSAALILSDGVVRALDLLTSDDDGCRYPFPDRVLLSACSSSGASEGNEWLGLAPAALWAGARTVIATSWSVLDAPETRACDLALSRILRRADDVAVALRQFQLEHLTAWRLNPEGSVPPIVWAAYALIEAGPPDDSRGLA